MTLAQTLRPAHHVLALLYDAVLILGGSILIALSAQVSVLIPLSPVPVTGQTFAVLFLGALLGSARGAAAVLAYLAEGIAGMPVFAGGSWGIMHLLGPTGGYLVGFVGAAYLTGFLAERGWNAKLYTVALAMLLGNVVLHAVGAVWLAFSVGFRNALALGVLPFLVGDALKVGLASVLLPPITAFTNRHQRAEKDR